MLRSEQNGLHLFERILKTNRFVRRPTERQGYTFECYPPPLPSAPAVIKDHTGVVLSKEGKLKVQAGKLIDWTDIGQLLQRCANVQRMAGSRKVRVY